METPAIPDMKSRVSKISMARTRPDRDSLAALLVPLIREVPNFPEPGVDVVVGIEARGFLLGAAAAYALGVVVVGVRRPGKLPVVCDREGYSLEYGVTLLELADGVLRPGQRALMVDDVLATGGTAAAGCALVERAGATVSGIAVVLEIASLAGRDRLAGRSRHVLVTV